MVSLSNFTAKTINFVAAIILLSLKFGLLGNLINPYLRIMLLFLVNILPEDCYKAKKTICSGIKSE